MSVLTENLSGHSGAITCLTLAEDEAYILSGSADNTIKVWSITMGTIVTDYQVSSFSSLVQIESLYV